MAVDVSLLRGSLEHAEETSAGDESKKSEQHDEETL